MGTSISHWGDVMCECFGTRIRSDGEGLAHNSTSRLLPKGLRLPSRVPHKLTHAALRGTNPPPPAAFRSNPMVDLRGFERILCGFATSL